MKWTALALALLVAALALSSAAQRCLCQVPITVWGYVKMPDGSPAAGASVRVSAGGVSKSTTADSSGKYKVDLTVPSVPVTVTVTASKAGYTGSATRSGVQGVVRIDVVLKKPSGPSPPPPSKKYTSLSISVDKGEYLVNETITVRGSISPAISVEVTVYVEKPSGSLQVKVKTGSDGKFSCTLKADQPGRWRVYAKFPGNDKYRGSTSNAVVFYVKVKPKVSLNVEAKGHRCLVVRGRLDPPVANATVMIYVSLDGGKTWVYLCNATTNERGEYEVTLNMTVSGELLFKAVLPGTETLAAAETSKPPAFKLVSEAEAELKQRVKELEKREAELKARIAGLEGENQQLRSKVEKLNASLTQASAKIQSLTLTLQRLNQSLTAAKEEASRYRVYLTVSVPIAAIAGAVAGILVARRLFSA